MQRDRRPNAPPQVCPSPIGSWLVSLVVLTAASAGGRAEDPATPPTGTFHTSWVGNSFGGDGGGNGFGYWVQNGVDEIDVTPDGTVIAGVSWDEAGRCVGLYREGKVNRVLLKAKEGGRETAWGWNTGNNAVAASGSTLYLANTGKQLVRFAWTPGDLDSARYVDEVGTASEAVGLAARKDVIVVVLKDSVEIHRAGDLSVAGRFKIDGSTDAAIAPDGSLWILADRAVRHFTLDGKELDRPIPGLDRPSALAFDNQDRLIVCDNGRRQQVLFFDVTGEPKLAAAFGDEGGLLSGTPGRVAPRKLFALRGAGTDAKGNLYVAMSFGNGPNGNCFLRSFTPAGNLRWELMSTAFVDRFGFDPDADGSVVYGRTAIFNLDLARAEPGHEWSLLAVTVDPVSQSDEEKAKHGCSVILRRLEGKRLLYTIGQYGGGYRFYTFDEPEGQIAHDAGKLRPEGETWAWDVDDAGGIWHGDAAGKAIHYFPFRGWKADGKPDYDEKSPQSWPWPEGWALVRRVLYDKEADALYLTGYLDGQRVETWGVTGPSARRYDGWLGGKRTLRWTNRELPRDGNTDAKEGPLSPQAVDIAGEYMFLGLVKPTDGKQLVHVVRLSDGSRLGAFAPGPAVGGNAGWLDMPYAVQAFRRRNGEYLVLVEEDFRGKNLLYRWRPEGTASASPAPALPGQ